MRPAPTGKLGMLGLLDDCWALYEESIGTWPMELT